MTNLDVRGTLVEGDDVGLGGVEVGEQLLVLLLLRHPVPAVPLLARRLLLLPSSLHLGKYFRNECEQKYLLTLIDGLAVLTVALAAHRGHCRALQNACRRGHESVIVVQ